MIDNDCIECVKTFMKSFCRKKRWKDCLRNNNLRLPKLSAKEDYLDDKYR